MANQAQDFTTITDFAVMFDQHPVYPDMHVQFNRVYGGHIEELDRFFTDDTRTRVRPHNEVDQLIRRVVVEDIIAPGATQTVNPVHVVTPLLQNAAISIFNGITERRWGSRALTSSLEEV